MTYSSEKKLIANLMAVKRARRLAKRLMLIYPSKFKQDRFGFYDKKRDGKIIKTTGYRDGVVSCKVGLTDKAVIIFKRITFNGKG
jgi:hypothetical protein